MRHLPEHLLQPLLRILNEYEAELRSKKNFARNLRIQGRLCDVGMIKLALQKQYGYRKRKE